jgi:hypothetical protein
VTCPPHWPTSSLSRAALGHPESVCLRQHPPMAEPAPTAAAVAEPEAHSQPVELPRASTADQVPSQIWTWKGYTAQDKAKEREKIAKEKDQTNAKKRKRELVKSGWAGVKPGVIVVLEVGKKSLEKDRKHGYKLPLGIGEVKKVDGDIENPKSSVHVAWMFSSAADWTGSFIPWIEDRSGKEVTNKVPRNSIVCDGTGPFFPQLLLNKAKHISYKLDDESIEFLTNYGKDN